MMEMKMEMIQIYYSKQRIQARAVSLPSISYHTEHK